MKLIRTEDAVGHVLCHDMTQIIPGEFKGARFRKGHIVTEEDIPVMPQGKPLTVEACLDKDATRTTLDSDGLKLLWEAGDQLAVYSSFIGSETSFEATPRYNELYTAFVNSEIADDFDDVSGLLYWIESGSLYPEYQKNGILTVTDASAGSANGTFTSANTADAWFGKSDSEEDENYWFTAYYPAPSQDFLNEHPLKSFPCSSTDMSGVTLNLPWVMVNVPSVQDGKSWSRYQVVVCFQLIPASDLAASLQSQSRCPGS